MTLSVWTGSIIPDQNSSIADRFYSLRIVAGPNYPDKPPQIRFAQRVALGDIVNGSGQVVKFNFMAWNRESSIFEALVCLRTFLSRAHLKNAKVGCYRWTGYVCGLYVGVDQVCHKSFFKTL
jgi:ubiquitin-conjugating enzyme E2 variant